MSLACPRNLLLNQTAAILTVARKLTSVISDRQRHFAFVEGQIFILSICCYKFTNLGGLTSTNHPTDQPPISESHSDSPPSLCPTAAAESAVRCRLPPPSPSSAFRLKPNNLGHSERKESRVDQNHETQAKKEYLNCSIVAGMIQM